MTLIWFFGGFFFADKLGCFFRNELHFIVKGYANVPARDMVKILSDLSNDDHAQFDAFVCCIASHGRRGTLFGSDCREIKVHEVTGLFNGSRCVSLSGKPKCFFIQGCSGDHFSLKGKYSQQDCLHITIPKKIIYQRQFNVFFLIFTPDKRN